MSTIGIFGIIVIVVLLAMIVLITVQFLKVLSRMLSHADRVHERANDNLQTTLDRLMAMNFHEFKNYQIAEKAPQGGYEDPAEEEWAEIHPLPGLERAE